MEDPFVGKVLERKLEAIQQTLKKTNTLLTILILRTENEKIPTDDTTFSLLATQAERLEGKLR